MNVRVATKSDLRSMERWSGLKTEPAYLNLVIPGVVGASVIFTVSSEFAMLNNLVTNPKVSRPTRQKAIDILVAYILEVVKKAHIKHLIAFSVNESTINRATKFGFQIQNDIMLKRSF